MTQSDVNKRALTDLAAQLSNFLQNAAERSRQYQQADNYKELGVEWNEASSKIQLPGIPEAMPVRQAIQTLIDLEAVESQRFSIQEFLPGMPYDAAHAFVQVLKGRYGWVNAVTKQTMFGPEPPQMVTVRTGVASEDFVEVPVGKFKLQDITAELETGFARDPKNKSGSFLSFYVSAEVRHEDRKVIQEIINLTRDYLKSHSIYQGKAMRLPVDSRGQVESDVAPTFIDLSKVSEAGLVLTKVNYDLLNHTVWTPIRKTAIARKHNVPLKRGALLWGPYGTGKTLSALVTAKIAEENGWTFIMLDDPKGLVQALEMAKLYQPAVVFAEDIDRVVVRDRDDNANDILNTIDGALQKNSEVITVLTTNHIDKINQGMLRPGRLDALIHVTKPDAVAAERLVRLYAGDLLAANVPLGAVGKLIEDEGYIPAIIAEIVNRAKLGMIFREERQIVEDDLLTAAELMRDHSKRLEEDKKQPSPEEAVGIALKKLIGSPEASYDGDLGEDLGNIASDAESAKGFGRAIYDLAEKELIKIRKLLEAHGNNGSGHGPVDLTDLKVKLEKIGRAVGVAN